MVRTNIIFSIQMFFVKKIYTKDLHAYNSQKFDETNYSSDRIVKIVRLNVRSIAGITLHGISVGWFVAHPFSPRLRKHPAEGESEDLRSLVGNRNSCSGYPRDKLSNPTLAFVSFHPWRTNILPNASRLGVRSRNLHFPPSSLFHRRWWCNVLRKRISSRAMKEGHWIFEDRLSGSARNEIREASLCTLACVINSIVRVHAFWVVWNLWFEVVDREIES